MKYGKFESFEAFIESYTIAQRLKDLRELEGLGIDAAKKKLKKMRERDVVEVSSVVVEYPGTEGAGAKHQHVIVEVKTVIENDPDVKQDLKRVTDKKERVFVSIRYGDRQGLPHPVPGVAEGVTLTIRGEWIPKEKAYSHGGEKMSVLHFTHHPIGHVCTEEQCYK
jgi:endonuclease G, mitochondrial